MKTVKFLGVVALTLVLAAPSWAGPVPVGGLWQEFLWVNLGATGLFGGCAPGALFDGQCSGPPADTEFTSDPVWTFTAPSGGATLTVVAAGLPGTTFTVFEADSSGLPISLIGNTPDPTAPDFSGLTLCDDPVVCMSDPTNWSFASFFMAPGSHVFAMDIIATAAGADIGFFRVVPEPSIVPEPSAFLMVSIGLAAIGWWLPRRNRKESTRRL